MRRSSVSHNCSPSGAPGRVAIEVYIYIYIAGISATPRPTQAEASARRPSRLAPRSHDFRAPAVELALVDDNVLGIRQNALPPIELGVGSGRGQYFRTDGPVLRPLGQLARRGRRSGW